jgi:hypothetical protein
MTIFLILAPFGVFALLMVVTSAALSLFASAAVCVTVIGLDVIRGRSVKLLGAGSAIVFASLGAYVVFLDPHLSPSAVRVVVDIGVFAISLGSMLMRRPFTLQYAIESVAPETASMPGFVRANYVITGAWTGATVFMMAGNAAAIYLPGFPLWSSLLIAFAARNSAVFFTKWYPHYRKIKYAAPPSALPSAQ